MNSSTRIAVNTAAAYINSLFAVGFALFSSRWILNALGEADFGLFNVVGSLIIILSFLNSVMANSSARHFAYAIGQGYDNEVNKWFNTAISIHLILSILLILVGWQISEYVIKSVLNVPPERIDQCVLIFRISLIGSFVSMVSIPFSAMFIAKQRIAEIAYWGVLQAFLIFILAWVLTWINFEKLIFYACGNVSIYIIINLVKISRALVLFQECRIRLKNWIDIKRFKKLFSFAVWSLIGQAGGITRIQGSNILINIYFGPVVNAAYGIANQVTTQIDSLSAAMMGAISPEITALEGSGQREKMIDLALRACKFGTLLVLLFAIPFMIEADYILHIWLITPPQHTAVLCQFMMATFIVDKLAAGYMYAVNAYGKIAAYQATVGTMLLMTLPLAFLFCELGMPPVSIGVAFLLVQILCSIGRILWARQLFKISIKHWIIKVVQPCLLVLITSFLVISIPRLFLQQGIVRLAIICIANISILVIVCRKIALTNEENIFVMTGLKKIIKALIKRDV